MPNCIAHDDREAVKARSRQPGCRSCLRPGLFLLIAGEDGQHKADHGSPGKKAMVFHGASLLCSGSFIRFVRLCRLKSRVEELCSSALKAGGKIPRAPSKISAPLKPMTK